MPAKKRLPPSQTSLAPPQPPQATKLLYCSYCGYDQTAVSKLIAGLEKDGVPVCICDHCVMVCLDILIGEETARRKELARRQKQRKNGNTPAHDPLPEDH